MQINNIAKESFLKNVILIEGSMNPRDELIARIVVISSKNEDEGGFIFEPRVEIMLKSEQENSQVQENKYFFVFTKDVVPMIMSCDRVSVSKLIDSVNMYRGESDEAHKDAICSVLEMLLAERATLTVTLLDEPKEDCVIKATLIYENYEDEKVVEFAGLTPWLVPFSK